MRSAKSVHLADVVLLAYFDAVVAQDRVGGRRVEEEVRQRILKEVIDPAELVRFAANGRTISRPSEPSISPPPSVVRKNSIVRSIRAISSAKVFSLSSYGGGSAPASLAAVPRAKSLAIWICLASGSMSGYRRASTSTVSSISARLRVRGGLLQDAFQIGQHLDEHGHALPVHR